MFYMIAIHSPWVLSTESFILSFINVHSEIKPIQLVPTTLDMPMSMCCQLVMYNIRIVMAYRLHGYQVVFVSDIIKLRFV